MENFLNHMGVTMADMFAGFAGGVVNAFVFRRSGPWEVVGSVVVGTFTAAYLGPIAPAYLGLKPSEGIAFIVGLAGMSICQGIVAGIKRMRWSPPGGGLDVK